METFRLQIIETRSTFIEVEAENLDDATRQAEDMYYAGEVELENPAIIIEEN